MAILWWSLVPLKSRFNNFLFIPFSGTIRVRQGPSKDNSVYSQEDRKAVKTIELIFSDILERRKARARQLDLDSTPVVPKPADEITSESKKAFINQFSDEMKLPVGIQVEHIRYIPFKEFLCNLQKCMQQYTAIVRKKPKKKTALLIDPGHSQHWVASHALKYLSRDALPDISIQNPSAGRFFRDLKTPNDIERVVMFDDWSISGVQMNEIFENIMTAAQDRDIEVVFVTLYITDYAKDKLSQHKNLTLIDADRILTTSQIPGLMEAAQGVPHYARESFCSRSKALLYSDWKVPDAMSMPLHIVEGYPLYSMLQKGIQRKRVPVVPDVEKTYRKPRQDYF